MWPLSGNVEGFWGSPPPSRAWDGYYLGPGMAVTWALSPEAGTLLKLVLGGVCFPPAVPELGREGLPEEGCGVGGIRSGSQLQVIAHWGDTGW